jgi:hypothetical protein
MNIATHSSLASKINFDKERFLKTTYIYYYYSSQLFIVGLKKCSALISQLG